MSQSLIAQRKASIANGQTTSGSVYLGSNLPVALQMPAAFTGATVSFQGSYDGVTYQEIDVGGAAYSETVTQGKNTALDPSAFLGFRYMKVVSASAEGAARTILVSTRRGDK